MNNQIPDGNDHLTAQNITEWINGWCSDDLQLEYRQHCIRCADCRERVAMISKSTQPDAEMDQSPEFQELLRIGEQVALRVWQGEKEIAKPKPKLKPKPWEWIQARPSLLWAGAAILLLALAIPGYRYWQSNQPVERAMSSMRQAWNRNRPIETRVTGNFPYLPYAVTRGSGDKATVNQAQLLAATADLAREVAERPTPRAKHALGRLHLLKEEFDDAEKLLKEVVNEQPQNAQAYVDLASVYFERGVRTNNLLMLAQAAENLTKATEISPKLPEAWFNLALCHEQMALPDNAQADWKKYLELDSSSPWAAEARANLEHLTNPKKSFVSPDRLAEDLLAIANKDEMKFRRLVLNNFITAFELSRGDFLDKYLKARINNDQVTAAKYLDVMRRTAILAKEEKAENYLTDLVTFVTAGNQQLIVKIIEIRALLKQGDQSHEKGNYTDALSAYDKAAAFADLIQDVCHAEHARYGLARIYIPNIETPQRQRLRETFVQKTGERNHKVLNARGLLALTNAVGAAQLLTKSFDTSSLAYQTALPLDDYDTVVNSLRLVGYAESNIGAYEKAVTENYQALRVINEHLVSPLRSCQAYLQMAAIHSRAAKYELALAYQIQAMEFCRKASNHSLSIQAKAGAAKLYAMTDRQRQAEDMFRESISELEKYDDKLGQLLLRTEINLLLGDAYLRQMNLDEAATRYQAVLELVDGTEHKNYLAAAHQGLAMAYLRQKRYGDAEKELLHSISLAEEIRRDIGDMRSRNSYLNRRLAVYRTMMDFQFLASNNLEKAFYYAELSRNRELLGMVATQAIIKWDSRKATLEYTSSEEILDLKRFQNILPPNSQVVEYAITDQFLFIWLITKNRCKSYSIPIGDQQLRQLCVEYLTELQNVGNAEILKAKAADLHNKLIKPFADDLDPNRVLVIIPDGVLGAIPFPALFSAESRRYLIEEYAIATIPSAGILAHTLKMRQAKSGKQPESLLVLSNPKLDPKQLPSLKPLPATEREAVAIASLYSNSLNLSREQATKAMLLHEIDKYNVIHLATHSISNEQNPLLSSVILSWDGPSPSASIEANLRAFEIFGLTLSRPCLVILSSCQSGMNTYSASNGMGGLAHAFFKAGVPAVIASLWEVEDQSAAELMRSFHSFHRVENQPFCQALRKAQLQMLNKQNSIWKHPYYWAAFQFSGNVFLS